MGLRFVFVDVDVLFEVVGKGNVDLIEKLLEEDLKRLCLLCNEDEWMFFYVVVVNG